MPLTPPSPVEFGGTPDPDGGVVIPRGAFITALDTFIITSLGIEADLLSSNLTLVANIYAASGLTRGTLLATASMSFNDMGTAFYDVPIDFTFIGGMDYDISISFLPSANLLVRFFEFDPLTFGSPPFEIAGTVRVRDGESDGSAANFVLPHLQLCTIPGTNPPAILAQPASQTSVSSVNRDAPTTSMRLARRPQVSTRSAHLSWLL